MRNFNDEIIYQIMPDRFNIGNNLTIHEKIKLKLYPESAIAKEWKDLPDEKIDVNHQYYGGDIQGVIEKLDYIQNIGATTIYFTPIFQADTYHKYDAIDYKSIDCAFGDKKIFKKLIDELHSREMKFIMDIALNHISNKHPYFQDAISNPKSPYRDFFYFTEYPAKYQCWWGNDYLPELNLENPDVIKEFITGKNSPIKFWLDMGVDGIRLDCANDLGVSINQIVYDAIKKHNPNAIVMGEIFNFAPGFTDGLDSLQTYFFTASIFSLLNHEITSEQFGLNIQKVLDTFDHEKLINSLSLLSSHDTPRSLTELKEDENKLFMALVMQFTLPGVPKIYYGEEIGMTGDWDPLNRAPMIWNEKKCNKNIFNFYKKLIELRNKKIEFRKGKVLELSHWLKNGVAAYLRYCEEDPKNYSLVIINPTNEKKKFRLFIPYTYMFADMLMVEYFTGKEEKAKISFMDIEINPMSSEIYSPDYLYKNNYSFYKRISPSKL